MKLVRSHLTWTLVLVFPILFGRCQQPKTLKFLALGDSYTIGESVNEPSRWPNQLADSLSTSEAHFEVTIVAKTGWRTDELMAAIETNDLPHTYDLVSLLIGVNNQYQGVPFRKYHEEFPTLLEHAIQHASGDTSRVIVLSIPDYYYTPFGRANKDSNVSIEIDRYNQYAQAICATWGVRYFDITPISRQIDTEQTLVASDGLHPSSNQYTEWIRLIMRSSSIREQFH